MTISSQIIEVLNHLSTKFGIAIDWTQENIVPYMQELTGKYISWEIATSWTWIYISIALIILAIVVIILDYKTNFSDGLMIFLSAVAIIALLFLIGAQIFDIIECNHFPEKAILEYIKDLTSNN